MTTTTPKRTTNSHPNSPAPYTGLDRLLIAGRWVTGRSDRKLQPIDPYRRTVIIEIPAADAQDIEDAYQAACRAQVACAEKLPSERSALMRRASQIMEARCEEIVSWLIKEAGSTRSKAMLECNAARDLMQQVVSAPYRAEGRILPSDIPGKESRVYRRLVGVVAVVSPWDFALHLANRSVAPALALGNAVVLKPPSNTPISGGLLLGKIYEQAGLPPGVRARCCGFG